MRRAYAGLSASAVRGVTRRAGSPIRRTPPCPTEKRYFDGPGTQLVAGSVEPRGRRPRPGHAVPRGCAPPRRRGADLSSVRRGRPNRLPGVAQRRHLADGQARRRALSPAAVRRRAATSADAAVCASPRSTAKSKTWSSKTPGAPYPRLYDHGYLVPTKQGYTFADPWSGESREIAAKLQAYWLWKTPCCCGPMTS